MENVSVSDFTVEGTEAPIFVRLGNRARGYREGQRVEQVGRISGVSISRFMVHNAGRMGCSVTGLPGHPVENVWVSDVTIHHQGGVEESALDEIRRQAADEKEAEYPEATMWGDLPAKGFFVRHARNVRFDNVRILTAHPDARPAMVCEDAE
jgi:hypothetical protein